MATFICFINWTEQGVRGAKNIGQRAVAANRLAQRLGGRLLTAYVTTGQYDVIVTLEMPSAEHTAKFVMAISAEGNVRTATVQAFPVEEFAKLVAEMPVM